MKDITILLLLIAFVTLMHVFSKKDEAGKNPPSVVKTGVITVIQR